MLFAVAVVIGIARAFQRDLIRRLRSALLLRRLRFGRGRSDGFVGMAWLCTADMTEHMRQIDTKQGSFSLAWLRVPNAY